MTEDRPSDGPPQGHVHPTRAGALVVVVVLGLVGGWCLRFIGERVNGTAPLVTWGPALALTLVAGILAWTALVTGRQIRQRRYLAPHVLAATRRLIEPAAPEVVNVAA